MTLQEFRKRYPQYDDLNDQELANAIHGKFYSDLPKDQVFSALGFRAAAPSPVETFDQTIMSPEESLTPITEEKPQKTARVRTPESREFAPREELVKGVSAATQFLTQGLPNVLELQTASTRVGLRGKELEMFERLDAGEKITPQQASKEGFDYARILQYQNASPERKQGVCSKRRAG